MKLENRINAFVKLGLFLSQFKSGQQHNELAGLNDLFYAEFDVLISRQKAVNGWFDRDNVLNAIEEIAAMLNEEQLTTWVRNYDLGIEPKTIGVVMAGNIPLVGFHDYLCVLMAGHKLKAKLSSNDAQLLVKVNEVLSAIDNSLAGRVQFVQKLEGLDAVIATGSNNTSRYFEHYFGKYPHIIRKNRNSVAVVSNDDSEDSLKLLANDVFAYYGLGCRSVSKLYIPDGFEMDKLFKAFFEHQNVIYNNKYANNYDYNKAIYLMGKEEILDNNFVLLREDSSLASPVGVLHYEYYLDLNEVKKKIEEQLDEIQCVIANKQVTIDAFEFGQAQCPSVADYADNVDTMAFLTRLT